MELICCGLAEEMDIAQIGEEEVYHQNLVWSMVYGVIINDILK